MGDVDGDVVVDVDVDEVDSVGVDLGAEDVVDVHDCVAVDVDGPSA